MKSLNRRLRGLQQRLGAREELIAVIALGVLASGGLAFTVVTNQGTPAGAALAYMAAVDRADTAYVWSHSIIDSARASNSDVSLFDRSALAAQLAATAHTRSGFRVQGVSYTSIGPQVTLTYNTSAGRKTTSLMLRGGAPHQWTVIVEPAGLDVHLPGGAGTLTIDGLAVAGTAGKEIRIAVFPGTHELTLAASPLYLPYSGTADAELPLPALAPVSFAKVQLTAEGISDVDQTVNKALNACAAITVLAPAGCPQSLGQDVATGPASWTLLGDPTTGSAVGLDDQSRVQVSGHVLMELSYVSQTTNRQRVLAVGGAYAAALEWDGQAFRFASLQATSGVPDLPRPAATDAQVLAALKAQFDSCLKLQAGEGTGCLQTVAAFNASNFVWHEDSDPLQGAVLAWDGQRGIFTVAGSYALSVDYDFSPPFTPTRRIHDTSSGRYIADLYWDGSKVVFIGLEK